MIFLVIPDIHAFRLWMLRLHPRLVTPGMLRLHPRLVTPEMQQRWLDREKQTRMEQLNVAMSMVMLGHKMHVKGGQA